MDWRKATLGMLVTSLFLVSAGAQYFDLTRYPGYCQAQGISDYCNEAAYNKLLGDAAAGNLAKPFVNEVAYLDSAVYRGPLQIWSVKADVVIDSPLAKVTAVYKVKNTASSPQTVNFMVRRVPENIKVFEDSAEVTLSTNLDSWASTFSAGQEKEIKLVYTEGTTEPIYSYNANLLIDYLVPADGMTPSGTFTMTMPEGMLPGTCSPAGFTEKAVDGRIKVTWEKTDFIPWTNPFDDLICNWLPAPEGMDITGAGTVAPPVTPTTAQKPADNTMLIIIVVIVALIAAVFLNSRRKPSAKPAARPPRPRK